MFSQVPINCRPRQHHHTHTHATTRLTWENLPHKITIMSFSILARDFYELRISFPPAQSVIVTSSNTVDRFIFFSSSSISQPRLNGTNFAQICWKRNTSDCWNVCVAIAIRYLLIFFLQVDFSEEDELLRLLMSILAKKNGLELLRQSYVKLLSNFIRKPK